MVCRWMYSNLRIACFSLGHAEQFEAIPLFHPHLQGGEVLTLHLANAKRGFGTNQRAPDGDVFVIID